MPWSLPAKLLGCGHVGFRNERNGPELTINSGGELSIVPIPTASLHRLRSELDRIIRDQLDASS